MFEPVYSSQGGPPKGYVCRVMIKTAKGKERFCGKACKTPWGMQAHGIRKHGMKLQMEIFDGEKVQAATNAEFESLRAARAAEHSSGSTTTLELFTAARKED